MAVIQHLLLDLFQNFDLNPIEPSIESMGEKVGKRFENKDGFVTCTAEWSIVPYLLLEYTR